MLASIIHFDIQTMLSLLFWCNLSSLALVLAYTHTHEDTGDKHLVRFIVLAKLLFALAFLIIEFKDALPSAFSVNIANSLVIVGALAEALAILSIIGERQGRTATFALWLTILGLIAYNLSTLLIANHSVRIHVSSLTIFAILCAPAIKLLRFGQTFKFIVGCSYIVYLALLLPRGVMFQVGDDGALFSWASLQSMSYLAVILLSTFNLPAFLLLMKEDADRKLRDMARTDFLSGLYNRQFFLESATILFDRHRRESTPCSVVFMDIDHFKRVNDTHGHAFGDEVIKKTASILKTIVRGYDLPCRFGGEEFACFVNNVDPAAALALAERIRRIVAEATFSEKPDFTFTSSIGVAAGVPGESDNINTFIDLADAALYRAKEGGRNRVVESAPAQRKA